MRHDPLNMFYNMRNPPGCFRLPVKACRPQSQIGSIDRFTTVQGFVANHEQGRVNRIKFSKEQRAVFTHAFWPLHRPRQAFSQEFFFSKFPGTPLTNAKKVFRKTRGCSGKNLCSFTRQTSRRSNIKSPVTCRMAATRPARGVAADLPA